MIVLVFYLKRVVSLGHIPVIAKRHGLAQKVGGSSVQYLCGKVFRNWSIIKLRESIHIY